MQTNSVRRPLRQHYDRRTDVLTLGLSDGIEDVTRDTESGDVLHLRMPDEEIVGVTVYRYCLRYGASARTLHVVPSLDVAVDEVDCDKSGVADTSTFSSALKSLMGQ